MTFDSEANVTGTYRVSVDTALTAGVLAQRSVSTFAITGTDTAHAQNADITAGYILKLTNTPPSTSTANTADYSKQDKWVINDANSTEVTIPVGTWVTITADVDTTVGKAYVTIVNADDNSVVYYEGVVLIDGTGELGGIDVLVGRGVGKYSVDSIAVELIDGVEFPEEEEVVEEEIIRYNTLVDYDFTNSNVPDGVTLAGVSAVATDDGVKLTNGYIELPSTLFANLPDDAKSLAVEITFTKHTSDWPENQWSERLFNFTDDNDTTDGVQTGTNGLGLSYNGNLGTTKNPYVDGSAYMDSALTGTYAIEVDTKATVTMELDFATNTATLYLNGTEVKSGVSADTITVADLQGYLYNTIGRSADMWSMWGFMTVESFVVSYK